MAENTDAIAFVRNCLKYTAAKRYVAGISAVAINNLWRTITETEYFGAYHSLHCGAINKDILRDAFLREMSYNPLRFEGVDLKTVSKYDSRTSEIVSSVFRILNRFDTLWPNGIHGPIEITYVSDSAYIFLRDLRDCFKEIARQNMEDFKKREYRDEIIGHFANAMDIEMGADIRAALQKLATESSPRRTHRRDMADLSHRIANLETQIKLHRNHDREFCMEMQAELEQLKSLQEDAIVKHGKKGAPHKPAKRLQARAPIDVVQVVAPDDGSDDVTYADDAFEREQELLRSMTPEHCIDKVFQDYVEQMVGLKLSKYDNAKQR